MITKYKSINAQKGQRQILSKVYFSLHHHIATLLLVAWLSVMVYAAPGDLDSTFGNGGKFTDWSGAGSAEEVVIQPDGKIVIVGSYPFSTGAVNDFKIARYNPDGSPDTTFGGGTGRVMTDFGGYEHSMGVAIQPDGKIVVGGSLRGPNTGGFVLARYNPNGSLDTEFGGGSGKVFTETTYECWRYSYFSFADVAILPDGKILGVVGYADFDENCQTDGFVTRYDANGSPDTSFGNNGSVTSEYQLWSLTLQPADGKIVAVGPYQIARFNPNGSLDNGFGSGGIVAIPPSFGMSRVAINSEGKILAAGHRYSYNGSANYEFALFRFNANGLPDMSFDGDGIVTTPSLGFASSVVIQSDAKIVAAGSSKSGSNNDFALARFNLNGTLDTAFGGGDGITTIDFNNSNDGASNLALNSQGDAVVVGYSNNSFALARFLLDLRRTPFDFDGDRRSDVSIFRPSDRTWYLNQSTKGFSVTQFGLSTDKITPADFDGDGKTDIAVYRDGNWYWLNSSNGNFNAVQFGLAGDVPLPADFTGDGRAELAVYRGGVWFTLNLSNNQFNAVQFGLSTDKPVPADFDGDSLADYAVYRDGTWYLLQSTQGFAAIQFGLSTDKLVPADYDGDGKTDVAVYREGNWYLLRSSNGFTAFQFGNASDIPAPADFDGDGRTDAAVYRDGVWYLLRSTNGFAAQQFGLSTDKPVPAAYLP